MVLSPLMWDRERELDWLASTTNTVRGRKTSHKGANFLPHEESANHLSRISTHWDLLFQAHRGQGTAVGQMARSPFLR
jgi:hypothetical protein